MANELVHTKKTASAEDNTYSTTKSGGKFSGTELARIAGEGEKVAAGGGTPMEGHNNKFLVAQNSDQAEELREENPNTPVRIAQHRNEDGTFGESVQDKEAQVKEKAEKMTKEEISEYEHRLGIKFTNSKDFVGEVLKEITEGRGLVSALKQRFDVTFASKLTGEQKESLISRKIREAKEKDKQAHDNRKVAFLKRKSTPVEQSKTTFTKQEPARDTEYEKAQIEKYTNLLNSLSPQDRVRTMQQFGITPKAGEEGQYNIPENLLGRGGYKSPKKDNDSLTPEQESEARRLYGYRK